jgi:Ribonuclease G/E
VVALGALRGRPAAALIVDGRVEDLILSPPPGTPPGPGAVFRAVADRPAKGLGGLFLRLPGDVRAFLRDPAGIAPGQSLVVQVTGWAEPGKAVPVTRRLVLRSARAILTPGVPGLNLSRQTRAADRERLAALARDAMAGAPADLGLILRRGAAGDPDAARAEIAALRALADMLRAEAAGQGPALLLPAPDAHDLARRDWADPPPDAVETDPAAFAALGVPEAADAALRPDVALESGATMWIEPTRALVAVDVNTGADMGPAAALKANLAAVRELPRQLRLRGLGGQVVIDPAPLARKDRGGWEQVLKAAFRADPVETAPLGFTPLGHYELRRRRERLPLREALA